jgi:hypothetical protein
MADYREEDIESEQSDENSGIEWRKRFLGSGWACT